MEKTVKKYNNFEEAEKAEIEYWQNASSDERVKTLLHLQELMLQLYYPNVKGMKKIVKIKKLKTKS